MAAPSTRRWSRRSWWPPTGPRALRTRRGRQARRPSRVGGLVTVLGGVLERDDATWVAAAVTEGDREVAPRGRKLEGAEQRVRYVDIPEERYDGYYNGIANGLLWFAHHYLWDLPRNPSFGERTEHEWADYVEANRAFARVLAAERSRTRSS